MVYGLALSERRSIQAQVGASIRRRIVRPQKTTCSNRYPEVVLNVLDKFRLDGKNALVTGASKNIGLGISRAFAQAGANVLMVARGRDPLESAAEEIRAETGATVHTFLADIGVKKDVEALLEFVQETFDQIDCLVNNAAHSSMDTPFFELEDEDWEQAFAINLLAPWRLTRGLGEGMIAGRGGSVINVLSGSGFQPVRTNMTYGTTKSGLWMMTRYLALECAPKIRANALVPGLVRPEGENAGHYLSDERLSDSPDAGKLARAEMVRSIAMGRSGTPSEIAPAAVYLASDAASYTTGALLFVNGGRPW
jgi:NAD(P)-dependent dehydrogenase (short-subunit alcohol dehydrogenase family)